MTAADPRVAICRGCGAPIIWFDLHNGRRMPVDAASVAPDDTEFKWGVHVSHFATCPQANQFRRRN